MLVQIWLCRVSGSVHEHPLLYKHMLSSDLSSHFTGSIFWAVFVHWQLCWISVCIHEQPPLYQHMLGTDFSGQLRGSKCSEHYL